MLKWDTTVFNPRPVHEVARGPGYNAAILTRYGDLPGYYLALTVDADCAIDAPLEQCRAELLKLLIPKIEQRVAELKAKMESADV